MIVQSACPTTIISGLLVKLFPTPSLLALLRDNQFRSCGIVQTTVLALHRSDMDTMYLERPSLKDLAICMKAISAKRCKTVLLKPSLPVGNPDQVSPVRSVPK